MSYHIPNSNISQHLTHLLAAGAILTGVAAFGLVLCATFLRWPSAPVTFAALMAATLGIASVVIVCANRVMAHQTACFVANREAAEVEIKQASAMMHKEFTTMKKKQKEADIARVTSAITGQESPFLRAVETPYGMG